MSIVKHFLSVLFFIAPFTVQAFTPYVIRKGIPNLGEPTKPLFHSSSLALNVWGVQKLGQSVINRNTTAQVVVADESGVLKFGSSVGSGADERLFTVNSDECTDNEPAMLVQLGSALKKNELLMSLQGSEYSEAFKMQMVNNAMRADDLLPKSLHGGEQSSPKIPSLMNAGLQSDWEMDI
mmetsp:Transcript_33355/g.33976  ORF Transcript_33355/g.33976 Transcript_33355/m.33976 type:complete len:180 (-) Transcript_33355:446-985(-)|eukprot:CAMPEP_0182429256 /NCGR_PEP_ID=MMETSP1167-20130531/25630_1 /TAXON_ID=2988 /ORGANISM="Mallomonas Sp, Strain CCMP3275" /LENGTH=179 /DNA_ID=CAMNT_0024612661 /DNA_START=89 /DNA_END=628 /DNA_ORIENTATION=-